MTPMASGNDPAPSSTPPAPLKYGPPISIEAARRVMVAAESEASANGWPMVIAIVDSGAHLVMLHRLDQAPLASADIAQRKARTAASFRRPSKAFEDALAGGGVSLRLLAFGPDLIPAEGGVPLLENGLVVGAIGVSGMQAHQDGQVAKAGARVLAPE